MVSVTLLTNGNLVKDCLSGSERSTSMAPMECELLRACEFFFKGVDPARMIIGYMDLLAGSRERTARTKSALLRCSGSQE